MKLSFLELSVEEPYVNEVHLMIGARGARSCTTSTPTTS